MPMPEPSCFRGGAAAGAPPSSAAPNLTTSTYNTHLGLAALTWSRTVLGLSLRIDLRLSDLDDPLRFSVRPWLLWKRRGSKRVHLSHRSVDVAWDLTRARFPHSHGGGVAPEPRAGFFVAVSIDGEMLLVAGDMSDEAFKKTKAALPPWSPPPVLLSRKEHVVLAAAAAYKTAVTFGGRDREIAIEIGGETMRVAVDGEPVVEVRRIRWKFRGCERIEVGGGDRIHISWDFHNWLFKIDEAAAAAAPPPPAAIPPEIGNVAMIVFRFENEISEKERGGEELSRGLVHRAIGYGGAGNNWNWSDTSSGGGGERKGKGRKKSLAKTSSSSSSSSAASAASSSSVMEWDSPEEAELRRADGFSLLVYAWKKS